MKTAITQALLSAIEGLLGSIEVLLGSIETGHPVLSGQRLLRYQP
jgi:hypothetical protein